MVNYRDLKRFLLIIGFPGPLRDLLGLAFSHPGSTETHLRGRKKNVQLRLFEIASSA